jgi:hypothetical protein
MVLSVGKSRGSDDRRITVVDSERYDSRGDLVLGGDFGWCGQKVGWRREKLSNATNG